MPLYEYLCDACGDQFELIRRFSDPPVEACPVCGGSVHKLLSSAAIQFKGSGWYVTDYAKKNNASESETEKVADKTSSASTDGKKDSATGKTTSESSAKDKPASTSSTSASASSTSK